MKNFTKKSILQKIIITILIILLLYNFIVPTYSHATGVLIDPIVDYCAQSFDLVTLIMQLALTGSGNVSLSNKATSILSTMIGFGLVIPFDKGATWMIPATEYDYGKNTDTDVTVTVDADKLEKGWLQIFGTYSIPINTLSPEEIFSGKVPALDINFISPESSEVNGKEKSTAFKLHDTIASWYVALRNLAIVGLLSVLVYVGIRIILSSTASDKAKYKQLFVDWLIAFCLLFFLHYIMSFTLTMVESICSALAGQDSAGQDSAGSICVEVLNGETNATGGPDFTTNLLGLARFRMQSFSFAERGVNLIIYGSLVCMTIVFAWTYLKRVVYMAFLTLIAPLVALTYPIDKINDGKAQAFNTWLREYVYNALLQPFHLILYKILIGSALDLAIDNPLYAIVALWFIYNAEKILRKFFGFDKASAGTMSAIGGIAIGSSISKIVGSIGKTAANVAGKKVGGGSGVAENVPSNINMHNHGLDKVEIPESQQGIMSSLMKNTESESNINQVANQKYLGAFEQNEQQEELRKIDNEVIQRVNKEQALERRKAMQEDSHKNTAKEKKKQITGFQRVARKYFTSKNIGGAIERGAIGAGKFAVRFASGTAGAIVGGIAGGAAGPMGILTGAITGANMGSNLGNTAINIGTRVTRTIDDVVDTYNGNTDIQTKRQYHDFLNNKENYNYIREKNKNEDGSYKTYTENMEELKRLAIYSQEGIKDIGTMYKARKAADTYGISDRQSAIITAMAQDRGITKQQLDDPEQLKALMRNVMNEYKLKDYTKDDARAQTNYLINAWKAGYGLDNNLNRILGKRK